MLTVQLWCFLLAGFCVNLASGNWLAFVGPRVVARGKSIKFHLASDFTDGETAVITLTGASGEKETKQIRLSEETEISIKQPQSELKNYTLAFEVKSLNFYQSVDIFIIPKTYSVIIQTDKATYKPGDLVNFRVLVINHETKLYQLKKDIKVEIKNPFGTTIGSYTKTKQELELLSGIFKGSFQIANNTILKNWMIQATVDSEVQMAGSQLFEVAEYVLPRFEVHIETRPIVRPNEGNLKLNVTARYTIGNFVKGKATVEVKVFDLKYPDIVQHQTLKHAEVEFENEFSFDVKKDLRVVNSLRPYEARFEVTFEEHLTGEKISKNVSVRMHTSEEFQVKLFKEKTTFRPGFQFKLKAVVRNFKGTLEPATFHSVIFKVNYDFKRPDCPEANGKYLDSDLELNSEVKLADGVANLILDVPKNTTAIKVTAQYIDSKTSMHIKRFFSNSKQFILIQKPSDQLEIGSEVEFTVEASHELNPDVHIIVIDPSGNLHTQVVTPEENMNTLLFTLKLSKAMAPSSTLLVYYIEPTGEIIYDSVKLDFEPPQENTLNITIDKLVKPGMRAKMQFKSEPLSHVFLLAVDKSVKFLGDGNDIDKSRLIAEMLPFTNQNNFPKSKSSMNRYFDFEESNTFMITNAFNGSESCIDGRIIYDREEEEFLEGESVILPDEAVDETKTEVDFDSDNFERGSQSKVRKNFAETWLFDDFKVNEKGQRAYSYKTPDTISTFIVTGFSVHPQFGLAIADPTEIRIFKEFFINLYIPYSIRLGEVLKVVVSAFNYISKSKKTFTASVTLHNLEENFEFVEATQSGSVCDITELEMQTQTKLVDVDSQAGASTFFLIRALKAGVLKLKLDAHMSNQNDEIENTIIVENEGDTVTRNYPYLIDLRSKSNQNQRSNLVIPDHAIWNSIYIEASTIGDLLGPVLTNVDNLIELPSGCTEQKFKTWIPNIAALNYLKAIGQSTEEKQANVTSYLSEGYQQILRLQNPDGSYSFWGEKGDQSVWLTAYVLKILKQANRFIAIESRLIAQAIDFIKGKQNARGGFTDAVHDYYYINQTGSQRGIPMTAFIAISILEGDKRDKSEGDKAFVDRCLKSIDQRISKTNDNLAFAMTAYAFALNDRTSATESLEQLFENALSTDDKMFWHRESTSPSSKDSPAIAVEIAAYAIMALVTAGRPVEAVPIVKWLMEQRNVNGGFYSTTDTVLATQALAMIGSEFYSPNGQMNIKLDYGKNRHNFMIKPENAMTVQHKELQPDTRSIAYTATGSGVALFQVSVRYNTPILETKRGFKINANLLPSSTDSLIKLKVCASYIAQDGRTQSGMTLIEVHLPSGYISDPATDENVKLAGVKKTETQKQKTIIVLYLNSVGTAKICLEIVAVRKNIVAQLKQSIVKIYDFYNRNERASAFYSIGEGKICG